MSLLAYTDFSKCPAADLVGPSQRIKIASDLNYELLKDKSTERGKIILKKKNKKIFLLFFLIF